MHGTYSTYEEAVIAAKKIIDDFLAGVDYKKMTAEQLFSDWTHYGDNPFISGDLGKAQVDELKPIVAELEKRMKINPENFAEILKPIDLPLSRFFSASEYAKACCRKLCPEEGAASKKEDI